MWVIRLWLLPACAVLAFAQGSEPPEIQQARDKVAQVRSLVEAGAVPAARLREAKEALQEIQDEVTLRRTLYGSIAIEKLTEDQAEEMAAAARRRSELQAAKVEKTRALIEAGAASQQSLATLLEEAGRRRKVMSLAESRARLVHELAEMARAEETLEARLQDHSQETESLAEKFEGSNVFRPQQLDMIQRAFQDRFQKELPVSANGATAVHRALGFDHRGRVDVALDPDQPEGVWLRSLLRDSGIPYFAFRSSVPGKSTGAHIHIGPPSDRLPSGG